MKKLKIRAINKYKSYVLECENKIYYFTLEFYDMPEPKIGDILLFDEEYLNTSSPDFVQSLYFEPLDEKKAKEIRKFDIAGLQTKDKNYLLRRIYG